MSHLPTHLNLCLCSAPFPFLSLHIYFPDFTFHFFTHLLSNNQERSLRILHTVSIRRCSNLSQFPRIIANEGIFQAAKSVVQYSDICISIMSFSLNCFHLIFNCWMNLIVSQYPLLFLFLFLGGRRTGRTSSTHQSGGSRQAGQRTRVHLHFSPRVRKRKEREKRRKKREREKERERKRESERNRWDEILNIHHPLVRNWCASGMGR